jgi:hypothetical protein
LVADIAADPDLPQLIITARRPQSRPSWDLDLDRDDRRPLP